MNPLKKIANFLFIEEEDNEIIEETQAELESISVENKINLKDVKKNEINKEAINDKIAETKEIVVGKSKKLSEIVPKVDFSEMKQPVKKKHISIEETKNKLSTSRIIEQKTYKYQSTPIISPIFGISEQAESMVIVATKPQDGNTIVKSVPNNNQKSKLDTIISPIYGTKINYEPPILVKVEETFDYFDNNVVVDEIQRDDKKEIKAEDLSLDDILETPIKRVLSKAELNHNMTIFDEDLKVKE
jgi:hypothetical protein